MCHTLRTLITIVSSLLSVESYSQTLKQILLNKNPDIKDVEITKCKASQDLFIAILIREEDWWEDIAIVKFSNGKMRWLASFDTLPSSQSILSAKQISLKGIHNPVFEVFDVTHQGNGYYYLYELKGQNAKLLIQTRGVDRNFENSTEFKHNVDCSIIYKNDQLTPTYKDINKDGIDDVILKGVVQVFASDQNTKLAEYSVQKVFIYDRIFNKYIEDMKQRKGFSKDDD